jgi:trans-aconitate methyltransferase
VGSWLPGRNAKKLAAVFAHPGVAQAYQYRPPYPAETFDILERVVADRPADVLDLGAGEGAIARPLAARLTWGRIVAS